MNEETLRLYFPAITEHQISQLSAMESIYPEWNAKINVISRKDIGNLFEHHILHSLAIAACTDFPCGASVLDVGTGGGFPGIPLAVMFPEVSFTLIDSIGKKLRVAEAAVEAAGLENVTLTHENAVEEKGKYNFVVSRAVMGAAEMIKLTLKNISGDKVEKKRNAFIFLKGGNIDSELRNIEIMKGRVARLRRCSVWTGKVNDFFKEEYFKEKYIIKVLL